MEVYVLLGGTDYEGHVLLGVFSSWEIADDHRVEHAITASAVGRYDYYEIVERVVDGAIEPFYGV